MFCRKMYRLINQGSHTVNSWEMKCFVGTEKTSAKRERQWKAKSGRARSSLTVQLLQGELLGFSNETEDHKPGDKVEPSIETDWS